MFFAWKQQNIQDNIVNLDRQILNLTLSMMKGGIYPLESRRKQENNDLWQDNKARRYSSKIQHLSSTNGGISRLGEYRSASCRSTTNCRCTMPWGGEEKNRGKGILLTYLWRRPAHRMFIQRHRLRNQIDNGDGAVNAKTCQHNYNTGWEHV